MTEAAPLSVTEITEHIRQIVDGDRTLRRVYIRGELSNYKIYPSGHHYFTLKDAGASLRCVMFRTDAQRIRFRPENGMSVVCAGRISVYPRDGAYQLYAASIVPDGIGDLYAAYEQLKEKLYKEGLFADEHKKPIPVMPQTIALITSGAGAAVRDMIRILGHRWPLTKVIVMPVRVQGTEAPAEIVGAIRYANSRKIADLIITGRGGGSIEDLWAFNDERVARAIYESVIPVISAVGHEPDVTIADWVADKRASTPSNGAEIAVPDQSDIRASLASLSERLSHAVRKKLDSCAAHIEETAKRPVMESPTGFIQTRRLDLDRTFERMNAAEKHLLLRKRQEYVRLVSSLEALSPLKVLSRGFSVATDANGTVLRNSSLVTVGDNIHIQLEHGGLDCRVEQKSEEK